MSLDSIIRLLDSLDGAPPRRTVASPPVEQVETPTDDPAADSALEDLLFAEEPITGPAGQLPSIASADPPQEEGSRDPELPSEFAIEVARLVGFLPADTVSDLRDLLALSLAAPSVAEARQETLGLLVDMVAAAQTGEIPGVQEYEAERRDRAGRGETWKEASTLARAYGGWLSAVQAAMTLAFRADQRVPRSTHHARADKPQFNKVEIARAIIAAATTLGHWPLAAEFELYCRLGREMHRRTGRGYAKFPSMTAVNTKFGGYPAALRQAKAMVRKAGR